MVYRKTREIQESCLFVYGFTSLYKIFHLYGNFIITGKGLRNLTYARHSWSLSSEDSLECHSYSDMGHPFIMVILKIRDIAERLVK